MDYIVHVYHRERPQYPCDRSVRLSITNLEEFEILTVPRLRPSLGQRSSGSRTLEVSSCDSSASIGSECQESCGSKTVRFDDSSNELISIYKGAEEVSSQFWYSHEDFDRFTQQLAERVEHECFKSFTKQGIQALEQAHLACMNLTGAAENDNGAAMNLTGAAENDNGAADDAEKDLAVFFLPSDCKEQLVQTYCENSNLVGLEPYISEYLPGWRNRCSIHKKMVKIVMRAMEGPSELSPFRKKNSTPLDTKCRRVSLGSRAFAQAYAEATAASVRRENGTL